jgi:hypothetical protein
MGTGSLQTANPAGFLFCCTGAILDFGQKKYQPSNIDGWYFYLERF